MLPLMLNPQYKNLHFCLLVMSKRFQLLKIMIEDPYILCFWNVIITYGLWQIVKLDIDQIIDEDYNLDNFEMIVSTNELVTQIG